MFDWFAATLKQYPEIAIFLTLAFGYYFGKFTIKGIGLGSVTATLLAGVVIGQIGITINQPLKATVFLMFLFAVGYGVGPQFVRGVAKDGLPQALYAVVVCLLCLASGVLVPKLAADSTVVSPVSRNGRHYVTDVWSQMTLFAIALPSPTYDWSTLTFCGGAMAESW